MEDDRVAVLQSLTAHPGWRLLRTEIERRLTMDVTALTTDSSTATLDDVRKIQGRIAELRVLRDWPEQEAKRLQAVNRK